MLRVVGEKLPQRQQEGLETVIGARRRRRWSPTWWSGCAATPPGSSGELQGGAASALATGSAIALVAMAFLAVLREGLETAVFLLAVFQDSDDTPPAGSARCSASSPRSRSATASTAAASKINLSHFFRATGVVLVLVAAGLLASSLHTAHEAGWFNGLQPQAVDLALAGQAGHVRGSLLTGMLGLQPSPTVGEAIAYLLYAIPMCAYVLWPHRTRPPAPAGARATASAQA